MSKAQELIDNSQSRIVELKESIELMQAIRSDKNTTMLELRVLYPEIVQEIDDEIAAYDWRKDT